MGGRRSVNPGNVSAPPLQPFRWRWTKKWAEWRLELHLEFMAEPKQRVIRPIGRCILRCATLTAGRVPLPISYHSSSTPLSPVAQLKNVTSSELRRHLATELQLLVQSTRWQR